MRNCDSRLRLRPLFYGEIVLSSERYKYRQTLVELRAKMIALGLKDDPPTMAMKIGEVGEGEGRPKEGFIPVYPDDPEAFNDDRWGNRQEFNLFAKIPGFKITKRRG